jgi:hypothetical protein
VFLDGTPQFCARRMRTLSTSKAHLFTRYRLCYVHRMICPARCSLLAGFVLVALLATLPASSDCQSLDSLLNKADKASLDSAAFHVAQKIQQSYSTDGKAKVLVIDFFRGSAGTSSRLGTLLADRFSESLSNFPNRVMGHPAPCKGSLN